MTGWTCPKCGRCYAPWITECWPCNNVSVAMTTIPVPADLCPSCRQTRAAPALTGCPMGSHYEATCDNSGT